jgi:hypothetical protein
VSEPTLSELRQRVAHHLTPGAGPMTCPVCTQRIQLYRRKLHSGMAWALVALYNWDQRHPGVPMDYRRLLHRGASRDHGFLRFWGLAEATEEESKGEGKGFYRITELGRAFVEERVKVPKAIYHFNKECYLKTKGTTTIRYALGDKFDLDELLRS